MSRRVIGLLATVLCFMPLSLVAQSYSELLAASPAEDWRELEAENTLYLTLASGTVIIELAPLYAPNHVANIKALAAEGYYDGLAIVRSHDNYVVQWADPNADKPDAKPVRNAKRNLAAEYTVKYNDSFAFTALADHDGYAPQVGHSNGFAVGRDPQTQTSWLTHCYGAVGVSRGVADNSGDGTSLYVVTGHAPRHLDRNITVVGRVVKGMELLSTLPRGSGALGFYSDPASQVPIESIQHAAAVAAEQRLKLEVLRTDTATFTQAVASLRNRGGDWYKRPAGYIELCNVWVPSRVKN